MAEASHGHTPWGALGDARQLALREAYQQELDGQPPTCSLDAKMERFAQWLAGRGVAFSMDDLQRPKPGQAQAGE